MVQNDSTFSRAQESRAAIERLYIEMRHLFNSGHYRNLGLRGEVLTEALHTLSPEIYGSMGDWEKVELEGLVYVIDRLPKGIEECRFVRLISEEGFRDSEFEPIVPTSRRRNCYRIDEDQMFIEVTRGRSEIYDILTHLTFMYIEAEKIRNHAFDEQGTPGEEWKKLKRIVNGELKVDKNNHEVALTYLSSILGRTLAETRNAYLRLKAHAPSNSGLFHVVYHLGKIARNEAFDESYREITFSPTLRERIGHHIYGEKWADNIKRFLHKKGLFERPLHIVSANLHSVMNCLYAQPIISKAMGQPLTIEEMALELRKKEHASLRKKVADYARKHGLYTLEDRSGTNISVQVVDTSLIIPKTLPQELEIDLNYLKEHKPVIIVMDYAFGEQAYETMDELLKPFEINRQSIYMPIHSISIMGKAGILTGGKGDIMIPTAHVFEGTADNYPLQNDFTPEEFVDYQGHVCTGPMITVLGTSLQNREVLAYFKNSSWKAIGLEMEGAHYQKAIQAETQIRKSIQRDIVVRYAYYASDNPLISGGTLASGSLGEVGVRPTYCITIQILGKILQPQALSSPSPTPVNV